jgi:ribosome-associated heat shock protein Hsp15
MNIEMQERVRLDKWLWAARFFKTRAIATQAIEAGHVRRGDRDRLKPSLLLKIGDVLTIKKEGLSWTITVLALTDRRQSATLAAQLYSEDETSRRERETILDMRRQQQAPRFPGRPTKRDRRALEDFLSEP